MQLSEPSKPASPAKPPRDLTIRGQATSTGGEFRRVFVQGEGDVSGDLTCETLRIQGTVRIRGNLKANLLRLMGSSEVDESCTIEEVRAMGDLNIHGDCSAERFRLKGGCTISGLLNAGDITLRLYGPASIGEIGGDHVRVQLPFRLFSGQKRLSAGVIEGDDLHLEYTTAQVVRGKKVWLGPGCDIRLVEYTEDFHQHKDAHVDEAKRV